MPERAQTRRWITVGLVLLVGACVTYQAAKPVAKADRGIRMNHPRHEKEAIGCEDCHSFDEGRATIPKHDMCSTCHDIDEKLTPSDACKLCHTRPDHSFDPYAPLLDKERKFSHEPHQAAKLECKTCHPDPDAGVLPTKDVMAFCMDCHAKTNAKMNECQVCHTGLRPDVRPTSQHGVAISFEASGAKRGVQGPESRQGAPISHDPPEVWLRVHGQESRLHAALCALCHPDKEAFCADCHHKTPPQDHTITWRSKTHGFGAERNPERCAGCHADESRRQPDQNAFCEDCHHQNPPQDHTIAWRRDTHGLGAETNRERCAACHEEDFCVKCHENTAPSSHRAGWRGKRHGLTASVNQDNCLVCHKEESCRSCHERTAPPTHHLGWDSPLNRHCASCHFPLATTSCAMCHESVLHAGALPSGHGIGVYPKRCGLCHPAALPGKAPHLENSSLRCTRCH